MSPANAKPVRPWAADRHIDVNADLHHFFDWLVSGKTVLDVGAGLGKSKTRIRHNRVQTQDISEAVSANVDWHIPVWEMSEGVWDIVTAFEVIEHIEDDRRFLQDLDALATQAVFLTTPNWDVARCQSADHHREYTHAEWEELICGAFPGARWWWGAYYKDAEGGWCELLPVMMFRHHRGLKHLVLVDKGFEPDDRDWLNRLTLRGHAWGVVTDR